MATKGAKKAPVKRKGAKGYMLPDPIKNGEILRDMTKKEWQIGPSIGVGGFGEIYSATDVTDTPKKKASYPYVVKIEPHGNGPLFVEMHFYMKVAKPTEIESWMNSNNLKRLGIPRYLGSGSHDYNGQKYRFVVMDRYGKDLWSIFLQNNRKFPYSTVLRIGLQVIDVLEYIHSKMYVHADIKGSNLLLGIEKGTENQVYLVDFGLASRYSQKEYKPDPKKAHNGTIEYTSRDAHMGVPTRRGDMEIVAYNLLQWIASKLPWEDCLTDPVQVQKQKTQYMDNIPGLMKKCFPKSSAPAALVKYFEYVANMGHDDEPKYDHCRKLFEKGLKDCKCSSEGNLNFTNEETEIKTSRTSPRKQKKASSSQSDDDMFADSAPAARKKKTEARFVNGTQRQKQTKTSKIVVSKSNVDVDDTDDKDVAKSLNGTTTVDRSKFVFRAGEYKRLPPDQRPYKIKRQKKNESQ